MINKQKEYSDEFRAKLDDTLGLVVRLGERVDSASERQIKSEKDIFQLGVLTQGHEEYVTEHSKAMAMAAATAKKEREEKEMRGEMETFGFDDSDDHLGGVLGEQNIF